MLDFILSPFARRRMEKLVAGHQESKEAVEGLLPLIDSSSRVDFVKFALDQATPHLINLLRMTGEDELADDLEGEQLGKLLGNLGLSTESADAWTSEGVHHDIHVDMPSEVDPENLEAKSAILLKAKASLEVRSLVAESRASAAQDTAEEFGLDEGHELRREEAQHSIAELILRTVLEHIVTASQMTGSLAAGESDKSIEQCGQASESAVNVAGAAVALGTTMTRGVPKSPYDRRLIPKFEASLSTFQDQVRWLSDRVHED